ncbi:hypothetical protein [Burkholderia gladioli]|uniref:hypothetical protein n=1 Tax=Burkholderia gladioli TaxID=28095 RepID=UPI0034DADD00
MSDKLSDERDSIEYAIQVLRQVEAGDGTFVGQCADAIEGLEALLAASPAPAIPAVDAVAIRDAALEAAAAAVEDHQRAGREWVPLSLWGTLSREAAARIRALKAAPAISESEDAELIPMPAEPDDAMQLAGAQAIRFETTPINKIWTANAVYRAMVATRKGEKS